MIIISNGTQKLTVTRGAFKALYEDCGFYICDGNEAVEPQTIIIPEDEETEDEEINNDEAEDDGYEDCTEEDASSDLDEIPLSEMSYVQLQQYADKLDIDCQGMRSKKELRNAIRQVKASR